MQLLVTGIITKDSIHIVEAFWVPSEDGYEYLEGANVIFAVAEPTWTNIKRNDFVVFSLVVVVVEASVGLSIGFIAHNIDPEEIEPLPENAYVYVKGLLEELVGDKFNK